MRALKYSQVAKSHTPRYYEGSKVSPIYFLLLYIRRYSKLRG